VDQALSLDGLDDFVTVGNPANLHLSTSDFTVDAWVNFDSLVFPPGSSSGPCFGPGCDMSIINKMDTGGPNGDGWRLAKESDNRFWFCLGSPANGCDAPTSTTVVSTTIASPGVWYHVAGVKSSQAISIYVNGFLEASKPLPSFVDTDSADVLIGHYIASLMYGRLDEVEIFNRALSSSEIQAIYNAGSAGKCKTTPPVGGIAQLPDIAQARSGSSLSPAEKPESSTRNYPVLAAAILAAALAVTVAAWYTRRWWVR
jgi:hypothetical protein